jgi:membrane glycosyltransferase
MVALLFRDGWHWLNLIILILFVVLFAQVSFGVTLALTGFWILRQGDPLLISQTVGQEEWPKLLPSTAVVMPIYNEEVGRVFQGIRVMYESLVQTARAEGFDFFVLSDSSDPNHWIEEEKSWLELCRQVNGFGRIFYRKRRVQLHHKSGNIADFCRRWGANYRYMIVLDADSIMTGRTMVRLVELMVRNRTVGIIQTAPQLALGNTLFRRIQQFAARLYGPIFMAGAHFWHLGSGNYWGHNAIIRLKLFMEQCALPELPKLGSLGGRILSHDTVEAALIRQAGYGVWFAYDLEGSYEEGPPELVASLQRDRRWCQGNMQHILVLFRRGLRLSSRIHILLGIMSYASAPLWLISIILSTVAYFVGTSSNHTPAVGLWLGGPWMKSGLLFGYVMFLLLLPKFLGAVHWRRADHGLKAFGGAWKVTVSIVLEIAFSMLLAPLLMMFYTRFVLSALTGVAVNWGKQKRSEERPGWVQLAALLGGQTFWGAAVCAFISWRAPELLPWLLPVLTGMILSIPFARVTSSSRLGEAARTNGWFLIPEETDSPPELQALDERLLGRQSLFFQQTEYIGHYGLLQAILDPYIHAIHVSLLRLRNQISDKTREYSTELRARLLAHGPDSLTQEERNSLLWNAEALILLHRDLWLSSGDALAEWWRQALRHYNESTAIATRRSVAH